MSSTRYPAFSRLALAIGMALISTAASTATISPPPPAESREAIVLNARLAPGVSSQGLSPWSREFTRQVESNPGLRARVASPARVDAINPAFAGFAREVPARELESTMFRPYRWVRLSWKAGSDSIALAERLRGSGLFDHVEPEPSVAHRRISPTQSSTITDPLYTATSTDPHRRQWAIDQADFKDAFHYTEGRVLIGVPDFGINPDHPDLSAAQRSHQRAAVVRYRPRTTPPGSQELEGEIFEVGFFPQATQLNDDLGGQISRFGYEAGHGLHVAGIIAARKNNAEGGVGGCPGCGIAPLRFADPIVLPEAWQALGFSFGVSAINMSFAMGYLSQLQLDTLTALNDRDVALVAAIGNEARKLGLTATQDNGRSAFPGYLPFVIGVGATDFDGERWHERTVMTRPLGKRHPQIAWDAVLDEWGCGLQPSSLGLPNQNTQRLPVNPRRDECGSNWGRETRSTSFVAQYNIDGTQINVTLPPGEYGLDLMAPGAQVLAPLDRVYSQVVTNAPVALRDFPCWFDPSPQCEVNSLFLHKAPGRHLIANDGQAMGTDEVFFSFSQIPRNEETLGYHDYGTITGTSMAAPLATAAVGLVRSANPLVGASAVHDLLRCTANLMSYTKVWSGDPVLNPIPTINDTIRTELTGSGMLDAEDAVRRTLGTVSGQTLRNRLIPMFSLTTWPEAPRQSWLFTTSPQVAVSGLFGDLHRLIDPSLPLPNREINFDPPGPLPMYTGNPLPHGASSPQNDVGTTEGISYVSAHEVGVGGLIPRQTYHYPSMPRPVAWLQPSASFFVFSTPFNPLTQTPNGLKPLHRMSMKCKQFRHHFYTTISSERQQAIDGPTSCSSSNSFLNQGWYDDGIDGYVYDRELPQPPGTVALWRGWLASISNWVLMTAEEQALGKFPGVVPDALLGYVYPAVKYTANGPQFLDDDLDTLPNAFETLIGLGVKNADSDGDGRPDGTELPFAAPGVSDPAVNDTVLNSCVP